MITVFDLIDMAFVAAVIVAALACRAWWARWAVAGLVSYHLFGRLIAWHVAEPLPELALAQLAVAAGYLAAPVLSVYGRIVGALFAVLSMTSVAAAFAGHNPPLAQGLALDLWNIQTPLLNLAAATIIIGIVRREHLVADRPGPDLGL